MTELPPAMNRSLSMAACLSIVLHGALLSTPLGVETELAGESSPPVLELRLQPEIGGNRSLDERGRKAATDALSPPGMAIEEVTLVHLEKRRAVLAGSAPAHEVAAVDDAGQPSAAPAKEHPDSGRGVLDPPGGIRRSAPYRQAVLSAAVESERERSDRRSAAAEPASIAAPAPAPERRMLRKKFQRWSETFDEMQGSAQAMSWSYEGREYTATATRLRTPNDMATNDVIVEIVKQEAEKELRTEIRMKQLAFSNFALFVDRWDPSVEIHGDEVYGRFHSNSEAYIGYDQTVAPIFHGKVTTAFRRINTSGGIGRMNRDEIFPGGVETGVRRITLPKRFTLVADNVTAGSGPVRYFQRDTQITFYADGTYAWREVGSTEPARKMMMSDERTYLVGARKAALYVKGVVNGKVLVYSPSRIVIEGDLTYARVPDAASQSDDSGDSDDYIGLVSDKYVEIADPEVIGSGDLLIHAAIYAKRRLVVKAYRAENDGVLFILGSLATGSMPATEPRYRTQIRFDGRLEKLRPPGFPVTNRYEMQSWNGRWETQSDPKGSVAGL